MINAWLGRIAVAATRLLPRDHHGRMGPELEETIRALAADARTRQGRGAERRYLVREIGDLLMEARLARQRRRGSSGSTSRQLADALRDDVRASLRQWRRRPVAAVGLVGTLAMAMAAVITTFGLARAVLWRPLPFPDAERLVFVWETADDEREAFRVTAGRFFQWQRSVRSFSSTALFGAAGFSLDGADGSVPIRGVRVSASYFDILGVRPRLGRGFDVRDAVPGAHRVVVLAEGTWRGRFGGAADIVGRIVRLSGEPYEVVGVMPDIVTPGWPSNPARVAVERDVREFWVPIPLTPALESNTRSHVFGVVARLGDGVSRMQADAELQAATRNDDADRHAGVTMSFREQFVGDARAPLLVLFAGAIAVLLVAAVNLAALQVSRFEQRRGELATRAALGAGRLRLAGLLAVDGALLAAVGAAGGAWMSHGALAWIPGQLPASAPLVTPPALDMPALAVGCLAALAIAAGLSLWPMLRLGTVSALPRGATVRARTRVYRSLVSAQVAVGVALAVPAALLGESLASVRAREPGFVVDGVLAVDVSIEGPGRVSLERASRVERAVLESVSALPGVTGATLAYDHPLEANWTEVISLEGDVSSTGHEEVDAQLRIVGPGYFDVLGVRVVDGRPFDPREDVGEPGVVLVNEAFAAAHGGRVIGRHLRSRAASYTWAPDLSDDYEIVGVVENERFRGLDLPSAPAVYVSTHQFPQTSATLLVRTADPVRVGSSLRAAIRAGEPATTIAEVRTLSGILAEQLASRRVTAEVTGMFAVVSVLLAVLGLYGLMAVVVAGRTRDLGVRLALGASPRSVARTVVLDSVGAAGLGALAGSVMTLAIGPLVAHLLVDVSPRDPWTVVIVTGVVLAAAVAAAALPARRASRIDPVVALRAPD